MSPAQHSSPPPAYNTLASAFCSSVTAWESPAAKLALFLGGHHPPSALHLPAEEETWTVDHASTEFFRLGGT